MFTSTITIEGRLAQDPTALESLTEFVVLVNRRRPDESGKWENNDTSRYVVKAFKALGEAAADLQTGAKVIVVGSIVTDSWDDAETSQKRYKQVIMADAIGLSL